MSVKDHRSLEECESKLKEIEEMFFSFMFNSNPREVLKQQKEPDTRRRPHTATATLPPPSSSSLWMKTRQKKKTSQT